MGERTEPATPRRRAEARQRGQGIGRSWEFTMGLTLGVGILGLSNLLPGSAARIISITQRSIVDMDPRMPNAQLLARVGDAYLQTLFLILPLAALVLVAGVAGNLVSGGLLLSPKVIRFNFGRMNPIAGIRGLLDKSALVRLGLAAAKLAILAGITWTVLWGKIPQILNTEGSTIPRITGIALGAIFELGLTITILLAMVALIDFVVQRRRAQQSIRMTKEEVKEEWKMQEGDPGIRGERRRRARQLSFARMMNAIPTADVIVTNPTTLAVALKYDSLTMRAPKIVAKGQRLMAERIKEIGRKHRVPIVEDKPLARALFSRPLGAEVPAHLYRAVARLLVLVHQARFGVAARNNRLQRVMTPAWAMAGGGSSADPWWMEAGASIGQPVPPEEAAARYGRVEGAESGAGQAAASSDGGSLEPGALAGEAMDAFEELGDVSPDELAELEAALAEDAEASVESEANERPAGEGGAAEGAAASAATGLVADSGEGADSVADEGDDR